MVCSTENCTGCGRELQVTKGATVVWCRTCVAWRPLQRTASGVRGYNHQVSHTMATYTSSYQSGSAAGLFMSPPLANHRLGHGVHGNKRALLCAVTYRNRKNELMGSVTLVNCMKTLLRDKFCFPESCILVLSEYERDPCRIPTKENIRSALQWLVEGCKAGDSLVFHFSGHGAQVKDVSGDEKDGYDEVLCPMDYETKGPIVDDEINETIVKPLPGGAKLHAIVDASHSGTVLDLPFVYKMHRSGFKWENQSPAHAYKGTSGGLAIAFSSCDDNQSQTARKSRIKKYSTQSTSGVMTYCFIQALECDPCTTYGRLLNAMRSAVLQTKTGILATGVIASRIMTMMAPGLAQEPQLTASMQFDINSKQFSL